MRRGTSLSLWKRYEAQQMNMVNSCMPRTVAKGIRVLAPASSRPTVSRPAVATFKDRNFAAGDIRVLSTAAHS
jgi:hypothetical protein